jgi:eukaryotic-like serine/threonine-protein kinase
LGVVSEASKATATEPLVIGRYALFDELAAGGMATVHLGRLLGPVGFGRTVAIKRLHSHYLKDQEFITMFMDEARIVARIRHPNVVPMVDVVQSSQGLFLIMEYIHGESLSKLMRAARTKGERIPHRIVTAIICNTLHGLHAAHETKGPTGELLGVVHRDVSPQNVIVGADGVARVLDFGIAKAAGRAQVTREGQIKGKLAYMAPEQIRGQVDRRTDVFAAAVCLWEALTGRRLHEGLKDVEIVTRIVAGKFPPPSTFNPDIPPALDQIALHGLTPDPKKRFLSAKDMALEIEQKVGLATPTEVSEFVERLASSVLKQRQEKLSEIEIAAADLIPDESQLPPPSLVMPNGDPVDSTAPAKSEQEPPLPADRGADTAFGQTYTQTTTAGAALMSDMPMPEEEHAPERRQQVIQWVVLGACALFALMGVLLGGYAMLSKKGVAGPSPSAAAPPSALAVPPVALHDAGASAPEPPIATPTPPTPPTPPPVLTSAAPSTKPSASAAPSASAPRAPSWLQQQPTATPPKKKNCEPPYTTDPSGKRHYKPECFDTL